MLNPGTNKWPLLPILVAMAWSLSVDGGLLYAQGTQVQKTKAVAPAQVDTLEEAWKSKMQLQLMEQTALEGAIDPEEYILGPGDEVVINIWGPAMAGSDLVIPPRIPVTPEGKILIPTVGDLGVGGLSLAEATRLISAEVTRQYRNVGVTVNLSRLRQFRVFVLGEVKVPGTYLGKPIDRVSALIDRAAGFTKRSSQRRIEVRRKSGQVLNADLVFFNRVGRLESNPQVLEGDVVFVPVQLDSVTISGAVNLPGSYEFKAGDTVRDIIQIAGGITSNASASIAEIVRFDADGRTTSPMAVDLDTILNDSQPQGTFLLQKDDQVFVRSLPEWRLRRTVTVEGEVRYAGEYTIDKDKSTLTSIIDKAGGFLSDASLDEAQVIRQLNTDIVDLEYERLRKMNVADMTAQERDYFKTKSREQRGVMVVDFRRLFTQADTTQDIILKERDLIKIPRMRNTVMVSGAVENPGSVTYEPSGLLDYYIDQAGGLTMEARKSKVRLIKGDTGIWLRPDEIEEIKPGDTVWVPEKPDRNWWGLFKDFMTVTAQVATIVIVIQQASGN